MDIIRASAARRPSELRTATFTGTVYVDPLRPDPDVMMANVFFAPGARTFWHTHERGQILVVTTGGGWICPAGEPPRPLHPGDTVWVPPGEAHWHGAGPDTYLTHLAISMGTTTWQHPVSDDEYLARP